VSDFALLIELLNSPENASMARRAGVHSGPGEEPMSPGGQ
jgi:hypothetical protein